ncbi:ABC transporter ATP-binding protein [Propionicicella superfundia]|uniref:ABC transporter ATP-binding protein n=1 Tax=Propionicicella superfundia TaxID=348582 RepID=UPI00048E3601|nr:ABC transporter ATP-binding protein [Propionicicella superfundia]
MRHEAISAQGIEVAFGERSVLDGVGLTIAPSEVVAICGASGCGKTTLLRVLAGIQSPDSGHVVYDGEDITRLSDSRRSDLRLREFGFVFQFGDLVPELSLRENIELPLEFLGFDRSARRARVEPLIEAVGLQGCCDQLPHTVSGGERQRTAVARAVAHRPRVVFADEPTGSLDTSSRDAVLALLASVARRFACALVMVTHDAYVAEHCDRVISLVDGRVASEPN